MSKKILLHRCSRCGKTATWLYMPSSHGMHFYCDDCVPRGCTCNVMDINMEEPDIKLSDNTIWWSKKDYQECLIQKIDPINYCTNERKPDSFYYEILDEQKRRSPCCEFDYSPDGYEREYNVYILNFEDIVGIFNRVIKKHIIGSLSMAKGIKKIIYGYSNNNKIPYNQFMTKISEYCRPYIMHTMFERDKLNNDFYNSFRSQVYEKKYILTS